MQPTLWRTETHWYRPIRLTDERRFVQDMWRGWVACGAIPPLTMDDMNDYLDAVAGMVAREIMQPSPILRLFR